jgi:preprotein translocase subunit SecD
MKRFIPHKCTLKRLCQLIFILAFLGVTIALIVQSVLLSRTPSAKTAIGNNNFTRNGGIAITIRADKSELINERFVNENGMGVEFAMKSALYVLENKRDHIDGTVKIIRSGDEFRVSVTDIENPTDMKVLERVNSVIMGKDSVYFQIMSETETEKFLQYYAQYPNNTFDNKGELLPDIIDENFTVVPFDGSYIAVKKEIGFDCRNITGVKIIKSNETKNLAVSDVDEGKYNAVSLTVDKLGKDIFNDFTAANTGKKAALISNNKACDVFIINDISYDNIVLTGEWSESQAEEISMPIHSTVFPVELTVLDIYAHRAEVK